MGTRLPFWRAFCLFSLNLTCLKLIKGPLIYPIFPSSLHKEFWSPADHMLQLLLLLWEFITKQTNQQGKPPISSRCSMKRPLLISEDWACHWISLWLSLSGEEARRSLVIKHVLVCAGWYKGRTFLESKSQKRGEVRCVQELEKYKEFAMLECRKQVRSRRRNWTDIGSEMIKVLEHHVKKSG